VAARHDHRKADRRDGQGAAVPGIANAWTMPIKARIDMLSTGIRTPIGIKGLRQ
jgi:Cu/Ag efflux pump CusA